MEDAIDAAGKTVGEDGTQVEIVLVPEVVTKSEKVVISEDKNIKLDLNGRTLNTTGSGYVIENYGKLEIVDTSDEESGKITSTTNNTIYNGSTTEEGKEYIDEPENIDLSKIEHNPDDQYYFDCKDGKLINNNKKTVSDQALRTSAAGYIKLDMTDYEGKYTLFVNAEVSTVSYYGGYGYVSISNKPDNSSRVTNTSYGQFMRLTNEDKQIGTMDIAGGQVYYLNFRYDKGSYVNDTTSDEFKINSITIRKKQEGELTITSGEIAIDKVGELQHYYIAIHNEGMLNVNGGKISSSCAYTAGVISREGSSSNINGGVFNLTGNEDIAVWGYERGSLTKITNGEMHAYHGVYTSTYTSNVEITGGTFGEDCYYQIHDFGSYSSIKMDGVNLSRSGSGYNIYLNVDYCDILINNCDIKNSWDYIISYYNYNNNSNIEIKNSHITANRGINLTNNSNLIMDNCIVETTNLFINSNGTSNFQIKGSTINVTGNDRLIYCRSNDNLTIIDSKLNNELSYNKFEGINISYGGTINISGTTHIKSGGAPIYSNGTSKVDVNIESGTLESTYWQAIEMVSATGTITLGEKGNGVKTDTPVLKSAISEWDVHSYRMNLRFYDGRLVGGRDKLVGAAISDIEDGYELVDIDDEDSGIDQGNGSSETATGKEVIALGEIQGVARVLKDNSDNGDEYNALESAVKSCEATEEKTVTIKLLKDIKQVRQVKIEKGQNIKIDLNGHKIYLMSTDTIYNEGTLEITDSIENQNEEDFNIIVPVGNSVIHNVVVKDGEEQIISTGNLKLSNGVRINSNIIGLNNDYKCLIKNEGELETNNIKISSSGDYINVVNNQGNAKINASTLLSSGTYMNIINNSGTLQLKDGKMTGTRRDMHAIYNGVSAEVEINGTNIEVVGDWSYTIQNSGLVNVKENSKLQSSHRTIQVDRGTIQIDGGTITSTSDTAIHNEQQGTININGGTIHGVYAGVTNWGGGTVNIKNATMNCDRWIVQNNNNRISGTVNIESGDFTTKNVALCNEANGIMNIKGGTFKSTNSNAIENRGTLTLGEKIAEGNLENEQPSDENPSITGANIGVVNNGVFNFYDGAITGPVGKSIQGIVTEKETGYQVEKADNGNQTETATLQKVYIIKLHEDGSDTDKDKQFTTLKELQDELNELENLNDSKKYTITILKEFSMSTTETLTIPQGLDVTLDLNGITILCASNTIIENKGKLTIKDSSHEFLGKLQNTSSATSNNPGKVIHNVENAELHIQSGSLITSGVYVYGVDNCNNSTAEMSGGTISTTGERGYGIVNENKGKVKVSGGTIRTTGYYSICVYDISIHDAEVVSAEITGGTMSATSSTSEGIAKTNTGIATIENVNVTTDNWPSVVNDGEGVIKINSKSVLNSYYTVVQNSYGGTLEVYNAEIKSTAGTGVHNDKTGIIKIDGAKITSGNGTGVHNNNDGKIDIKNSTIEGRTGINNYNGGTINISSGTITANIETGIYNYNNYQHGTINIEGGTIIGKKGFAIHNSGYRSTGTVNIKGGTIISENNTAIQNDYGELNIGEKINSEETTSTEQPNQETPRIEGKIYGVYSVSTFNYYDGIITGPIGQSVNHNITNVEKDYQVVKTIDNEKETAKLQKIEIMEINKQKYTKIEDIQNAIEQLTDGEEHTIKVINTMYMFLDDNIEIPENKNIILDLNGNEIITTSKNAILNNGTLKIVDNSETEKKGKILGTAEVIIKNKRDLTINGGCCNTINYTYYYYNTDRKFVKAIENEGNLTWQNGDLDVYGGNNYGIHNKGTGTINWENGVMNLEAPRVNLSGIYTDSSGKIDWKTGTINMNYSEYSVSEYAFHIVGTGELNINDVIYNNNNQYYSCYNYFIYTNNKNQDKNTINIDNFKRGTVSTNGYMYGIGGSNANVNIKNGTFSGFNQREIDLGNSVVNITGGTFGNLIAINGNVTVEGNETNINKIINYQDLLIEDGTIKYVESNGNNANTIMTGGNIHATTGNAVLVNSNGKFTLKGGTIESEGGNAVQIDRGTFIMGDNTNAVSTDVPQVNGNTYGVCVNSGEFDFYDGTITGNTKAIYGGVKNKPENYKVQYSDTDEKVAFLDIDAQVEKVVSVDGVYFSDFESALDHAMNNRRGTILVHKEMDLPNSMTIDDNTDITINLNGHSLKAELDNTIFTNNGALTIIDEIVDETEDGDTDSAGGDSDSADSDSDSSDGNTDDGEEVQSVVSKIENTKGYVVINNKTLTVGRKDNGLIKTTPVLKGQTTAIQNNGTFYWYDGVIDGEEITEEKTQSAKISSLARQIKAGADNMLNEAGKKILPLIQNPSIKLDTEKPIWTKGPVTATIYTTDRIILDIKNETANVEKRSLTVKKVWEMPDEEAQNYKSTIQLMRIIKGKKEAVTDKKGNNLTVEIIGNNSATFEDLPVYKGKEKIEYVLEEIKVQRRTSENEWEDVPMTDFNVTYNQMSN